MTTAPIGGDRTAAWRTSYRRVRKDPLRSSATTNRRRLDALGAGDLPRSCTWLDVGAGDGNLVAALAELDIARLIAVEPQLDLVPTTRPAALAIAGSAVRLPLRTASVEVVLVMDVLHHLVPEDLVPTLGELHRVLRPGGHLLVWEPARTRVRTVLQALLDSPLASATAFSRDKRAMVDAERDTLDPWLRQEHAFVSLAVRAGFVHEQGHRHALHAYHRFHVPDHLTSR